MASLKDTLCSLDSKSTAPLILDPNFEAHPTAKPTDRDLQPMTQHPDRELRYVAHAPDLALHVQDWFEKAHRDVLLSQENIGILEDDHEDLLYELEGPQTSTGLLYSALEVFIRIVADCAWVSLQDQGHDFESRVAALNRDLRIFPTPGNLPIDPLVHVEARFSQAPTSKPDPLEELGDIMSRQPRLQFPPFAVVYKEKYAKMEAERSLFHIPNLPVHMQSTCPVDGLQCFAALNLSVPSEGTLWPMGDFGGKEQTWDLLGQVWVEMEHSDQTVAVLVNSSCAFYAIRHRASRTLYVSSANNFKSPSSYTTISQWSGLLCLAFMDRKERELSGKKPAVRDIDDGLSVTAAACDPTDHSTQGTSVTPCSSANGLRVIARLGQSNDDLESGRIVPATPAFSDRILMIFRTAGPISSSVPVVLQAHKTQCEISTSSTPSDTLSPARSASHTEGSSSYCSNESPSLHGHDSSPGVPGLLVLLSKTTDGPAGAVWRGYFDLGHQGAVAVAAKIGDISDLERERDLYRRFEERSVLGVPTCLGLFHDPTDDPAPTIGYLLLSDEGDRVCWESMTEAERNGFIGILEQIHGAGVVLGAVWPGYLRRQSTSINSVNLAIVGFHEAEPSSDEEDYDDEMELFVGMLDEIRGND